MNVIIAIGSGIFCTGRSVGHTNTPPIYDHKLMRNVAASSLMVSKLTHREVNRKMTCVSGRGRLNIENAAVDSPTKNVSKEI